MDYMLLTLYNDQTQKCKETFLTMLYYLQSFTSRLHYNKVWSLLRQKLTSQITIFAFLASSSEDWGKEGLAMALFLPSFFHRISQLVQVQLWF